MCFEKVCAAKVNLAGFHTLTQYHKVILQAKVRLEVEKTKLYNGEFDPGSGRTLAACLTHASLRERGSNILSKVAHG